MSKKSGDVAESRVTVAVRLRPPANEHTDYKEVFSVQGNDVTIHDPLSRGRSQSTYTFSHVIVPDQGQAPVFNQVARPLVDQLLLGFNSCCFAYGQTGSGKTHSVFGEGNAEQRGMLARSIEYLFEKIEALADMKEIGMAVSFTEIYLDQVKDLGKFYLNRANAKENSSAPGSPGGRGNFSPEKTSGEGVAYVSQDLVIHESPQGLVFVDDLSIIPVSNIREVLEIANLGVRMRTTFETRLNARSSRSHTIFTVNLVQKQKNSQKESVVASTLNLIDLAGSERISRSQSEGRRFQEAVVINSSLSALGKVVLALAGDSRGSRHIPYRDSKLTRILQNSLGGNSHTTLLTTIDPSVENYDESFCSLAFADRCKNVTVAPVKNVIEQGQSNEEKKAQQLTAEIATLTHQLENATRLQRMKQQTAESVIQRVDHGSSGSSATAAGNRTMFPGESFAHGSTSSQNRKGGANSDPSVRIMEVLQGGGEGNMAAQAAAAPALQLIQMEVRERLVIERQQTTALVQKAKAATEKLGEMKLEIVEQEEQRRFEVAAIRDSNKELEQEIRRCKQGIAHLSGAVADQRASELEDLNKNVQHVVVKKRSLLNNVPSEVFGDMSEKNRGEEALAVVERRQSKENSNLQGKHIERLYALQGGHDSDIGAVEVQNQQWLSEKAAEMGLLTLEMDEYQSRVQWWQQQLRGDLVAAYDLVQQLARVVDNLETGVPAQFRSDIRPVRPGSAPRRPGSAHGSISASNVRKNSMQSLVGDAAESSVVEYLKREMVELRRQVAKHQRLPPLPAHTFTNPDDARNSAGSSSACPPMPNRILGWDAHEFARNFCDITEGAFADRGDASLQRLEAQRLRALCLSLRDRCHLTAGQHSAERQHCREAVAREMGSHARVDRIRDLEKEVESYRSRLRHEEYQISQIETALQSCARVESSRPTSAATTRPGSAQRSRPVSAGALVMRSASAGPVRY